MIKMKQLKETYINTLVDNMSMEDFKQYVKNDMSDFLCYCSESEVIKNCSSIDARGRYTCVVNTGTRSYDFLQSDFAFPGQFPPGIGFRQHPAAHQPASASAPG